MPTPAPYIPARDADLNDWAQNFSTLLTASPTTYGLVTGDATAVDVVTDAWVAAYAAAINPGTRTPVSVNAKDTAKINLLATVRPYAVAISLNQGVLDEDKIAIGVNPRTSPPTPIAAPTTNPILSVVGAGNLSHVLRYRDEESSPSVKAKPYGATSIQLFGSVSATPIVDPAALDFLGNYTKAPLQTFWEAGDAGKQAYYAARWVTRKGQVGPWSPVVNFTVALG